MTRRFVETYRGEAITHNDDPKQPRYIGAGWTDLTLEGVRIKVDRELALRVERPIFAEWDAAKKAKAIPASLTYREWREKRIGTELRP